MGFVAIKWMDRAGQGIWPFRRREDMRPTTVGLHDGDEDNATCTTEKNAIHVIIFTHEKKHKW